MRSAKVHLHGKLSGHLIQSEEGYISTYTLSHLQAEFAQSVRLTLPLREQPYMERVLFPFFDGLIHEGWLLEMAERNWELESHDRMGLLLACCQDCIGAVSIYPLPPTNDA